MSECLHCRIVDELVRRMDGRLDPEDPEEATAVFERTLQEVCEGLGAALAQVPDDAAEQRWQDRVRLMIAAYQEAHRARKNGGEAAAVRTVH